MGAGCGFVLLTPFTDHLAVWIVIIVSNASQGVYIGAVSIFNAQVMAYFRQKHRDVSLSDDKPTQEASLTTKQTHELALNRQSLASDTGQHNTCTSLP